VRITFNPTPIKKAVWANIAMLLLAGILLSNSKWRNKRLIR
jgi:hypothetical protein